MTDKTENTLPVEQSELLPCPNPWCEALERDGDFSPNVMLHHFGTYRVVCTSCRMEGPLEPTKAEAITAWNTRAALASHPPSGLVEALRKCRDQFEFYVQAHLAKQPPDMDKAATNQEFVELCDAALGEDHSHGG